MDEYAVLVFHDQSFTDEEQLAFARRLDGELHTKTGAGVLVQEPPGQRGGRRHLQPGRGRRDHAVRRSPPHVLTGQPAVAHGRVLQDPPGRYSMLSAKVVPSVGADTEFADTRGAYDALDAEMKARLEPLRVHHSIAHSRQTLGFEFSADEAEALKGAIHPLVRTLPRSNRRALYVASHASRIVDWPVPEGRLLLHDLHRARDAARVRLPSRLARRRPGDLGQPCDDAPRDPVRRHQAPSRAAPRDHTGSVDVGGPDMAPPTARGAPGDPWRPSIQRDEMISTPR